MLAANGRTCLLIIATVTTFHAFATGLGAEVSDRRGSIACGPGCGGGRLLVGDGQSDLG